MEDGFKVHVRWRKKGLDDVSQVEKYANDQQQWFDDFTKAFKERSFSPVSRPG